MILNCTPHVITIVPSNIQFPPSGFVPRLQGKFDQAPPIDGIPVRIVDYSNSPPVLPPNLPTDLRAVIVSNIAAMAVRAALDTIGRTDVRVLVPDTSPDSVIRNTNGDIVGVKGFLEV